MHLYFVAAGNSGDVTDLVIAVIIALAVVGYFVFRRKRRGEARDADRGTGAYAPVPPGSVRIIFHTYSGFLVYVVQRRREMVLTPAQARQQLQAALRHNLTWGMFAYGLLFIPILTYLEYRTQMNRINAADQRGFPVTSASAARRKL